MKPKQLPILVAAVLLTTFASLQAQQPTLTHAKLQTQSAAAGLDKTFRAMVAGQSTAAWIGYAVPALGDHESCCGDWNRCCGRCRLEDTEGTSFRSTDRTPVQLESKKTLVVLYRVESRLVGKIRTFSLDCELDAGDLPFFWLTDVRPAESVALLSSFATARSAETETKKEERRLPDAAVMAVAQHDDPAADRAFDQFVASTAPAWLREKAVFWLGAARGRKGYEVLRRLAQQDPSEHVRDKVTFALSVSKQPEAVDTMIAMARGDSSARVRGQALFWLGQKAGQKAINAIAGAIDNDPETDVKKKAVFALSQLPKDEGVPLLIGVARSNRNLHVRKQAMFWLGQSRDPRALVFFEEILTKK
ncbi:MAG: HEAT repeat domain-containing protein [Acidobacteriota bacterium]